MICNLFKTTLVPQWDLGARKHANNIMRTPTELNSGIKSHDPRGLPLHLKCMPFYAFVVLEVIIENSFTAKEMESA